MVWGSFRLCRSACAFKRRRAGGAGLGRGRHRAGLAGSNQECGGGTRYRNRSALSGRGPRQGGRRI